jgi:hypothetical protein
MKNLLLLLLSLIVVNAYGIEYAGVYSSNNKQPFKLTSTAVNASIAYSATEVSIEQVYHNPLNEDTEGYYSFPIDNKAAVFFFEARIGDRIVQGTVKEKEEAKREYNDAVKKGDTAFLLDETHPDIMTLHLGNIAAQEQVHIHLKYVTVLSNEKEVYKFIVPTTITPRYGDTEGLTCVKTDGKATFAIRMEFAQEENTISSVSSVTHALQKSEMGWESTFGQLKTDFVADILFKNPEDPAMVIEYMDNDEYALMLSFMPIYKNIRFKTEFIFVIDLSGSMEQFVRQLRSAMIHALIKIPEDCYFNIIAFGSTYLTVFPEGSVPYNDANLNTAHRFVSSMKATMSGTKMLEPLQHLYTVPLIDGHQRRVLILTDGAIANEKEVIELVAQNKDTANVFSLGIGWAVSRHLVEGLAKAGGGTFYFVNGLDDHLIDTVALQMQQASIIPVDDFRVVVNDEPLPMGQIIYDWSVARWFHFGKRREGEIKIHISMTLPNLKGVKIHYKNVINEGDLVVAPEGTKIISTLVAKDYISDITHTKDEIIAMALKRQLASKYTSFIGVMAKDKENLEDTLNFTQFTQVTLVNFNIEMGNVRMEYDLDTSLARTKEEFERGLMRIEYDLTEFNNTISAMITHQSCCYFNQEDCLDSDKLACAWVTSETEVGLCIQLSEVPRIVDLYEHYVNIRGPNGTLHDFESMKLFQAKLMDSPSSKNQLFKAIESGEYQKTIIRLRELMSGTNAYKLIYFLVIKGNDGFTARVKNSTSILSVLTGKTNEQANAFLDEQECCLDRTMDEKADIWMNLVMCSLLENAWPPAKGSWEASHILAMKWLATKAQTQELLVAWKKKAKDLLASPDPTKPLMDYMGGILYDMETDVTAHDLYKSLISDAWDIARDYLIDTCLKRE